MHSQVKTKTYLFPKPSRYQLSNNLREFAAWNLMTYCRPLESLPDVFSDASSRIRWYLYQSVFIKSILIFALDILGTRQEHVILKKKFNHKLQPLRNGKFGAVAWNCNVNSNCMWCFIVYLKNMAFVMHTFNTFTLLNLYIDTCMDPHVLFRLLLIARVLVNNRID